MDDLETLVEEIRSTDTAAVLTGAGISGPSGDPTFRGNDGVWNAFDEGQFTYGRFQRDPVGFWEDRVELHRTMFDEEIEAVERGDAVDSTPTISFTSYSDLMETLTPRSSISLKALAGKSHPALTRLHGLLTGT